MNKFLNFLEGNLEEALITFGGKAYPNFGNVLIMQGGAGSGKGHVLKNLVGLEGQVFDVDHLKELQMNSTKFSARVKEETGIELSKMNLRVPENVSKIHELLSDVYGITKKNEQIKFTSLLLQDKDRKPNVIFDVTMKDLRKLESISRNVQELGYKKENIHIVWVLNDLQVQLKQNSKRERVVPEEVLIGTHEGVSLTMNKLLSDQEVSQKYMDGDIWIQFNKVNVDSTMVKSQNGGSYIQKGQNYLKVKEQGKKSRTKQQLDAQVIEKIKSYVPEIQSW